MHLKWIKYIWILRLFFECGASNAILKSRGSFVKNKLKPLSSLKLTEINSIDTFQACLKECGNNQDCQCVSWDSNRHVCTFYNSDVVSVVAEADEIILIKTHAWILGEYGRYSLFHNIISTDTDMK